MVDRLGGGGPSSGAGADPEDVIMDIPIAQRLDGNEFEGLEYHGRSGPEQERDPDLDPACPVRIIANWQGGLRAAFSILNERAVAIRQSDGWKRALHHS